MKGAREIRRILQIFTGYIDRKERKKERNWDGRKEGSKEGRKERKEEGRKERKKE